MVAGAQSGGGDESMRWPRSRISDATARENYLLNIGNRPRKYHVWGLDKGLSSIKLDYRRGSKAEPAYFGSFLDDLFFAPFVERLTLCQWDFHSLFIAHQIHIRPKVHEGVLFSKLKEVWWIDNSMDQWKIESLISFLKLCPVLEKLLITVDLTCYVDNRFQDMRCKARANKVQQTGRRDSVSSAYISGSYGSTS
ncbi:hypothetical protein Droror1_Dr00016914 [Drosera rotundifolia]